MDASAPQAPSNAAFPMAEARLIARRYTEPDAATYWTDYLISAGLGWAAFAAAVIAEPFSLMQALAIVVAGLAHYRAVIFTHELAHLKQGTFGGFRFVWNMLSGVPFLAPSFSYTGVHIDHHRPGVYGSARDGEYVAFGAGSPWRTIVYVVLSFVLPPLMVVRFVVLTPLSYAIPPLRKLLWRRASSLAIDLGYDRHDPNSQDDTTWKQQEFAGFIFATAIMALVVAGALPLAVPLVWYAVTVFILFLNSLRTLAAHAYRYAGDPSVSRTDEFLDSVNVPGNRYFTPLWAPVGLRFHATHHLFPATPYHNLEKLHTDLVAELPDNALYLTTSRKNLFDALIRLWRDAAAADKRRKAGGQTASA